jgi:hypothetical protein
VVAVVAVVHLLDKMVALVVEQVTVVPDLQYQAVQVHQAKVMQVVHQLVKPTL